jgi:hypothetical protein
MIAWQRLGVGELVKFNFSFVLYVVLVLTALHHTLAQEQVIPPNAKDEIVLENFSELQARMNIGQYDTLINWPLAWAGFGPSLTIYQWYTPGLQQYPVVFSIERDGVTLLSYINLSSGGGGGICLCGTTIRFRSLEQLPNQLIRLEIEETYRLGKNGSYNDGEVFRNCPAENCEFHSRTRLAYIFDVSRDVLRCLACDIPIGHHTYVEFYDDNRKQLGTVDEEKYSLLAGIYGNTLIVKAVTQMLTDEQQKWLGTFTLR